MGGGAIGKHYAVSEDLYTTTKNKPHFPTTEVGESAAELDGPTRPFLVTTSRTTGFQSPGPEP